MRSRLLFIGLLLLLASSLQTVAKTTNLSRPPSKTECDQLLAQSSSSARSYCSSASEYNAFMRTYCWSSCQEEERRDRDEMFRENFVGIGSEDESSEPFIPEESFFDIEAHDIDGKKVDLGKLLDGKVAVITNVASYCDATEEHYRELVELYEKMSDVIEILAFPCNQFGNQEPDAPSVIKKFAQDRGVKFTIMEKSNVNGAATHPVYRFLKRHSDRTGPIKWNFGTYFVMEKEGYVHYWTDGATPLELREEIQDLLKSYV